MTHSFTQRPKNSAKSVAVTFCLLLGCGGTVVGEQPGNATGASSGVGGGNGAGGGNVSASGGISSGGMGTGVVDCSLVACGVTLCSSNSVPTVLVGNCCPTCVAIEASCSQVTCDSNLVCPAGFVTRREPGACCDTCYPTPTAQYPNCATVDCAPPTTCALGYHLSQPSWRCCNDCQPDPNYCESVADCVFAQKPTACCGCPLSISTRVYAQDPCYSLVSDPRAIPASCQPQFTCALVCGSCSPSKIPACVNNHCELPIPLLP